MQEKLIIDFTPTGMIPTKSMTPWIPVTPQEIIEDVHKACELGITKVHLHARNPANGSPSYEKRIYAEIIEGIRKFAPDLVICVSLSGRTFFKFEERSEALELEGHLKPDLGSLTLSSLNFNKIASINSPDMIMALAEKMKNTGIVPELEAFDAGMINFAKYLIKKKLLSPPYYFNLLLGNIACAQADILYAGLMIKDLPENSFWSLAGIGEDQLKMNSVAIAIGGGVRVGLEDNIWFDAERTILARNIDLLKRIHVLAQANNREIMKPEEFRQKLHMEPGFGKYGRKTL
ncbi:MAG TPA: 3-keto-5-aminohexanoate cleavage protein [Bacteroidales bacterium]|nr:3-keto-5-aminohexanoate cleavage protein [Bacteroidales bacterium]